MKVLHYFFSSLVLLGCKQEHSRTSANENETQVIIENHIPMQQKSRPYYTIQIAKGGSSLELSVNDFVVYRHMEQGGLTVNVPINATLMKSGTHDLRLKLNPDKGKTTLDEYTYATIEVRLFADVDDPAGEFQSVLKFDLPDEAKTSNLPYFEVELPFKAEVPFDISHILENAEVLKGQDNIEKEIIAQHAIKKGANAGTFLHEIFEKIDFTNKSQWSGVIDRAVSSYQLPLVYSSAEHQSRRSQVKGEGDRDSFDSESIDTTKHEALIAWIEEVLRTPLLASNQPLYALDAGQRFAELEFNMGLSETFRAQDINQIFQKYLH